MTLVAGHVRQRLREWGIARVHGCPGDGTDGMPGAFDRAEGQPEPVGSRHEVTAAFMARRPVHDPERAGIAAKGVRQKLTEVVTEVVEHLPGRHP
ncbi:thiamine pyrophosphate-binding protein [Streptomyces sp. NRRL S-1022]|uniref:thiamine pyrophosphate-binding protein n=1 Tax=Streptomyces sp. NRRL S-1022 TaxID=1463880 RepID=UPI000AD60DC9|nr:thiamine pyrophosphate-binding protein [Streptomyces sp. NRRL S-1022]